MCARACTPVERHVVGGRAGSDRILPGSISRCPLPQAAQLAGRQVDRGAPGFGSPLPACARCIFCRELLHDAASSRRARGAFPSKYRADPGLVMIQNPSGRAGGPTISSAQFRSWAGRRQKYFDGLAFYRIKPEIVSTGADSRQGGRWRARVRISLRCSERLWNLNRRTMERRPICPR